MNYLNLSAMNLPALAKKAGTTPADIAGLVEQLFGCYRRAHAGSQNEAGLARDLVNGLRVRLGFAWTDSVREQLWVSAKAAPKLVQRWTGAPWLEADEAFIDGEVVKAGAVQ